MDDNLLNLLIYHGEIIEVLPQNSFEFKQWCQNNMKKKDYIEILVLIGK